MSNYWEEARIQAVQAEQNETLGNYELAFTMYKSAIVSLLAGVQEENDIEHRLHVKQKTAQYLLRAEWIFNNHLTAQAQFSVQPKLSSRVPWRSRSQLERYKMTGVFDNVLLVYDVSDNVYVVIKGVLKSSSPIDRSDTCVLPTDVPYMVKLFALHETDTTVFFVLEHVRYGKLWNHLEHYFSPRSVAENLETELTSCATLQDNANDSSEEDGSIMNSNYSSNNGELEYDDDDDDDISLSRLESSGYTDTQSCESLSSHDENYFDLIEDFARAKVQKLKEIRDLNERRQRIETLRPVKKTVSQVDLKSLDDCSEQCRSHSLTDLTYDNEDENSAATSSDVRLYRSSSVSHDSVVCDRESYSCSSLLNVNVQNEEFSSNSMDVVDTQQLLQNAQKLIDSINETLAKSEAVGVAAVSKENDRAAVKTSHAGIRVQQNTTVAAREMCETPTTRTPALSTPSSFPAQCDSLAASLCSLISASKECNVCYSPMSAMSFSIPSITEDYSVTALLQKKGITKDLIKKWATEILIALDVLHQNGIICKDLNPTNILLSDDGSVKLTYFFQYSNVERAINTYAKERLYVAPEVLTLHSDITFASDWWSFGAILFELITLQTLYDSHPGGIHSHTTINIPEGVPLETRTLLNELLRYNPNERLGSGICGADDIKAHTFFNCANWQDT